MGDALEAELDALENILTDPSAEPIQLSYAAIREITSNFSEDNVIGHGGFGVVYKGTLWNEENVAVKKLRTDLLNFDGQQFIKEVKCLKRVKHKNIVRFLGYCADTRGEIMELDGRHILAEAHERWLCFEYVPNGNLGDFHALDWTKRYQIFKGICQGLHYLHDQHITHMDLKPENVLLDVNMDPKITDFGLSRFFDGEQTRVNTKNICGTPGYLPPEFIEVGEISYKSDIYSLGVIISKLSTGCSMLSTDCSYYISDKQLSLQSSKSEEHCQHMKKCFELAQSCMETDQQKRPIIEEILCKLFEIESQIEKVILPVDETSIDQTNTSWPLHVHPRKLLCPLMGPNKQSMPFSLHVTNKSTDDHIAFMFVDSGKAMSSVLCRKGVIPPQTTWAIILNLQQKEREQAVLQDKDMVLMRSTTVSKRFGADGITIEMFKSQTIDCVHDIELEVVFVEPPSQQQPTVQQLCESVVHKLQQLDANEGTSCHAITQQVINQSCFRGSIRTELLDIYPLELRYPRKPEKFCLRIIHLTNTTDEDIHYWVVPSTFPRYFKTNYADKATPCYKSFVPPQCTFAFPWVLTNEIYQPTNTESFEILMLTSTSLGNLSSVQGYSVELAEQVLNAARDKGGKGHRVCLFVSNNSGPEQPLHRFRPIIPTKHFGKIMSADVHPTEPLVLTCHGRFLCIWTIMKGRIHVPEKVQGFVDSMDFEVVKFIARKPWVLSGDKSGTVHVYDTAKLKLLHSFTAHGGRVSSLAVHPSHPYVLSASDDRLIKLWDWDNAWTCTREFKGHLDPVTQVVINPNNTNSFASFSSVLSTGPGNIKIWNINSTDPETDLYGAFKAIDWTAPVKDGHNYLVAIAEYGYIEIWDTETRTRVRSIRDGMELSMSRSVACHRSLPILVADTEKGCTSISNLITYRMEHKLPSDGVFFGFSDIAGYKSLVIGTENSITPVIIDLEALGSYT